MWMSRTVFLAAAAAGLFVGMPALALINPTFTPIHLVKQSKLILELQVDPAKDGKAVATVTRVVKGKTGAKTLTLDLTTCAVKEHAAAVEETIRASKGMGAAFWAGGADPRETDAGPAEGKDRKAFLHIGGQWLALFAGPNDVWHLDGIDQQMPATWQGGTDMLLRAALGKAGP
jgi:hypothetical protein